MNIKCPHCGKILLIKQQITDFSRVITCPVCKESSALSNFRILDNNRQPQGDHTQYGGQGGRTDFNDCTHFDETQATGHTNYGNSLIGSLTITGTPQASPCKLIIGKNIVGREWPGNSITNIQIPTPGKNRMSREHLVIEVKEVAGKGIVHYASLYKQNVNPTFINKERLMFGDCVILRDGDLIDLPDASLKFTLDDNNNQFKTVLS